MNNSNERNNLNEGSVFTELNLTLVKVTPVDDHNNGQDIVLIALERTSDKGMTVYGWLSKNGTFYFHCWTVTSIISRIEKELIDMGYYVKPRVYNQ